MKALPPMAWWTVDFKQMEKVNRSEGETYAQDLITAHPNLGAIFCHSEDPTMGAVSALEAAGRTDVLVAAFDCSPEIVEAIREGESGRHLCTAARADGPLLRSGRDFLPGR